MPFEFKPVEAHPLLRDLGIHRDTYRYDYTEISKELVSLRAAGKETQIFDIVRALAPDDLFFLLYFVLNIKGINNPFAVARCYEVQEKHDNTLDLWARGHYKSTINTYGLPIQEVLKDQEERIGLFSNTRALSINHLRRIKTTLETNELLIRAFPEIFYENPKNQAIKWSEEVGLIVKRKGVYREATFEAWGLVDYLPTGAHFTNRKYDDVIDARNVNTQAQIEKSLFFYQQSQNLVAEEKNEEGISGTRYSLKDAYADIIQEKDRIVRVYPAEVDEKGKHKRGGIPVMMSRAELDRRFSKMGSYVYYSQMLQHPVAESDQKFNRNWLKFWHINTKKPKMNYYILVDSAKKKEKQHDYTVMMVIGVDALRNYWLLDMVRDKMNIAEKWDRLSTLVKSYGITEVGYESYGAMTDDEFMERMMQEQGCYFRIIELGGQIAKEDRIKRMVPDFQRGRWILPESIVYKDVKGEFHELMVAYMEEYQNWVPGRNVGHDDMLDCQARIYEGKMNVVFPVELELPEDKPYRPDPLNLREDRRGGTWMAAG